MPRRPSTCPRRTLAATGLTLGLPALLALLALLAPKAARADESERGGYAHLVGAVAAGKSLRFNNPFRLAEPLGKTAESVSTGALYLDVAAAAFFGPTSGFQHGAWLHWSQAMTGVPQGVLTPSYALLFRGEGGVFPYARVGLPIVTGPDANVGGEAAAGAIMMLSGGVGLTAEVGGAAFYGAATREVSATLVPLLYGQLGVAFDWEALP